MKTPFVLVARVFLKYKNGDKSPEEETLFPIHGQKIP
jgi:hypothetical protein